MTNARPLIAQLCTLQMATYCPPFADQSKSMSLLNLHKINFTQINYYYQSHLDFQPSHRNGRERKMVDNIEVTKCGLHVTICLFLYP